MPKHIYLALAIHNHQPVGNFPWVFKEAYRVAYEPMIACLERHPKIRLALHYSGPLRDWLLESRPEFLQRVRTLVERGQVEIMTGGYYEPILPSIPDADKLGQIAKLTRAVRDDFGCQPTGLWLAERVWEPHLAKPLAEAGVEYIIVDDTHFKYVGLDEEELFGYYVTEEQGHTLKVFATSKWLRYAIPWRPVGEVIAWLRSQADEGGHKVAVMGDDGEKFGLWPGTYEHCWKRGWMEEFFCALEENANWLTTIPPGEYARRFPALGRIYLPTASYDEMTEWALPAKYAGQIVHLKHSLQEKGREDVLRFVKGGFWRYFLVKYPEINTMHKKMLRVSEKVHRMTNDQIPNPNELHSSDIGHWSLGFGHSALDHLWAGQCNCPYWHGVFGGVYLFHIRAANFRHLLEAEILADERLHGAGEWIEWRALDFDCDGAPELLVESDAQNLYFDPAEGGSLFEWDWRAKRYNLLNTMTRRPEGYHQDLLEAGRKGEILVAGEEGELETIHTARVRVKEPGLHERLYYDWYRRSSLLDHFLHPATTLEDFYRCQYGEQGDFVNQPYDYEAEESDGEIVVKLTRDGHVWCGERLAPLRIEKRVNVRAGEAGIAVVYTLTNFGPKALELRFGPETNWGIIGGDGPGVYYLLPSGDRFGKIKLRGAGRSLTPLSAQESADSSANYDALKFALNSKGELGGVGEIELVSEPLGMRIRMRFSRPANLWRFPVETISNSEAGFERSYQGSCLLPWWEIALAPGASWEVELDFILRSHG